MSTVPDTPFDAKLMGWVANALLAAFVAMGLVGVVVWVARHPVWSIAGVTVQGDKASVAVEPAKGGAAETLEADAVLGALMPENAIVVDEFWKALGDQAFRDLAQNKLKTIRKQNGIVGFGDIARLLASKAHAVGMKVLAYDPYVSEDRMRSMNVGRAATTDEVFENADFISLHVPRTPQTRS